MTFNMDTGSPAFAAKSAWVDDTQNVRFTDRTRADRFKRQTIEQIEAMERSEDVDAFLEAETVSLDGLHLFDPAMSAEVAEAAETHKAILKSGGVEAQSPDPTGRNPAPTAAQHGNTTKERPMNAFANFDTGGGGSEGPWLQWSARGTQDGEIPPKSFLLRDSDGKVQFDGFNQNGVVLDIENMQTGWCYSDGVAGQAPEWKMNQTIAHMMPQPGDGWKKGFKLRVAIGGGKTASWDQAGAAAFVALVPQLREGPSGKLPLVKMTGTKLEQFKRGSTVTPLLEVVKWVDRPDCLKADAPTIDTGEQAPAPKAEAPAKAPEPATAAGAEEYGF